ncbi:hypothetical protein MKX83_02945 [Cytobacillus sp. FSL M8-0252]
MTMRYETASGVIGESRGREEVIKLTEKRVKLIKQIELALRKAK